MKALSKTSKQLKHHQVENIEITEKAPSKKDEKQDKYYQISAIVSKNENAIDIETRSAGRFVIAVRPGVSRQGRCSHAIFAARNWAAYALLVENVDKPVECLVNRAGIFHPIPIV